MLPRTLLVVAIILAVGMFDGTAQPAHARRQYFNTFKKVYPHLAEQAAKVECKVCHPTIDEATRNEYGKAVLMGLGKGASHVQDVAKITEALKKSEAVKNADGKTFGEIIKSGSLPVPPKAP